ncbi:MAG: hypothetical protein IJ517_00060 [Alphaproteobacteria bacterium]|nr:hypothetical protein [Alphaproteobacteria bacterium]
MQVDEKMFQIGVWSMGIVLLMTVVLQVAFRTQNRQMNRVRRDIVTTQQQIAVAEANFASYVRPEILRNLVVSIQPKAENISFNKYVAINDLPIREEQ